MTGFVCELTPRCNLSCGFCYNVWRGDWRGDGGDRFGEGDRVDGGYGELPLSVWKEILDDVLALDDVRWVTFTGGEPLLYGELESLVRWARGRAPQVTLGLATNGTLLTDQRLSSLLDAGIGHIELPLLTLRRDRYAQLTGAEGGETRLRAAIAAASLAPVSVTLAITLLPDERTDLEESLELAHVFGADRITLNRFVPTGAGVTWCAGSGVNEMERLSHQLERANDFASSHAMAIDVTIPIEDCLLPHARFPGLRFHPCLCGKTKWAIDPLGRLRTCEQSSDVLADLRFDGIRDAITCAKVEAFLHANRYDECATCEQWERCGGGCRFVNRLQATS